MQSKQSKQSKADEANKADEQTQKELPYIAKLKSVLEARDVNLLNTNYSKAYWAKLARAFYNWPIAVQEVFIQAMQIRHGSDMRDFKTAMRLESDARHMWCVVYEPQLIGNPTPSMWYLKFYSLDSKREIQTFVADFSIV